MDARPESACLLTEHDDGAMRTQSLFATRMRSVDMLRIAPH